MKFKKTALAPLLVIVVFILHYLFSKISNAVFSGVSGYVATVIILFAVYIIPCGFFFYFKGKESIKILVPKKPKLSDIQIILSSTIFISVTGVLYSLVKYNISNSLNDDYSTIADTNTIFTVVCIVLLPVIAEEILFRGILLNEYKPYGVLIGITYSSICFAFMHFSPEGLIYYFITGVVLASAAYVTDSILTSAVIHLLHNLLTVFGNKYISNMLSNFSDKGFVGLTLIVLSLISLFYLLSVYDSHYTKLSVKFGVKANELYKLHQNKETKKEKISLHLAEVFLNPYFLILIVLFAIVAFNIL